MRNEVCFAIAFLIHVYGSVEVSNAPSLMLVLLLSLLLYLVVLPSCARFTVAGPIGLPPLPHQRLSHVPIRSEIAPSWKPCANKSPDDMRMKLFLREKGDAKRQRNR